MARNRFLFSTAMIISIAVLVVGGVAVAADGFTDVPDSHPFHDDIEWLADTGITTGYADGTYRPGQPVTRGSMAAFLRRLAGADPEVDPVVNAVTVGGRSAQQLGTTMRMNEGFGPVVVPDGGGEVEILTLTLGAGTWKVEFIADIRSNEAGVGVGCGPLDVTPYASTPYLGAAVGTGAGYSRTVQVASSGLISLPASDQISFRCFKPGGGAGDTEVTGRRAIGTRIDTLVNPSP